jgi:crotonobetainyl-CoA:carnitine CoA-transferase CaiB-like acyl-CoA transferase
MSQTHPFSGLIVVDFTHVLAGPACSYYLGLLGATVIKVESSTKGDAIRHRGGTDSIGASRGMSTAYLTQGAGKRSITLDLGDEADFETMFGLLSIADVFVENHRPETMTQLGLDETRLSQEFPHLIHCAMTGYGRGGPQENTSAYDVNIQASCGLMDATGTAESGPMRAGAPVLDYGTAMGKGTFVDVSMLETGLSLMSSTITDYLKTGNAPQRRGNLANSRSPGAGSFPCRNGVISLGVNEESHFQNLARSLDCDHWLEEPRFSKPDARKKHAAKLVAEIENKLLKKDAAEWEIILQQNGVPAARLRSLPEALASEQVVARGFVQTTDDGVQVPTLPFRLGGAAHYAPSSHAPKLGENSIDVKAWLDELLNAKGD